MDPAETSDSEEPDPNARVGPPGAPTPLRVLPPAPPGAPGESDVLFTPAFVRLLAMQAAYGFSFSMFFLLPKYLAAARATPTQIGFVMGGFGVACVLTIPFLQPIIARLGRRGALMAATSSLAVAGAAFAAIAPVGIGAVFLRAAEGVAWTIMFSTGLLLTAEMAPRHRLAQAIGLAGGAALIMNAVAPAVGEPLADRFGYRPVFLLAAVAALVAAAMARRLPKASTAVGVTDATGRRTPAPDVVDAPGQRLPIYLVFGISGLAFSSIFTFLAPFALAHGVLAIRPFFFAYTAAALGVRVLGGRMVDRIGHRLMASAALALYGVTIASTGVVGPHHLAALGFFFGLAHGAVYPAIMALLINYTAVDRRPRVLGMANGAMSIGVSAVFPAGILVSRVGYAGTFAVVGVLVAAAAAIIRRARR